MSPARTPADESGTRPDEALVRQTLGAAAQHLHSGDMDWLVNEASAISERSSILGTAEAEVLDFAAMAGPFEHAVAPHGTQAFLDF